MEGAGQESIRLTAEQRHQITVRSSLLADAAAELAVLCAQDSCIFTIAERKAARPGVPLPELLSPTETRLLPGAANIVTNIIEALADDKFLLTKRQKLFSRKRS